MQSAKDISKICKNYIKVPSATNLNFELLDFLCLKYSGDIHISTGMTTANEIDEISELEETLKWGEPSYLAKKGSTLRIDWKPKAPNQYAIFFSCSTTLVKTFKQVYGNQFDYEGKRAIGFQMDEDIPEKELKSCIRAALTYHRVKNLDKLGLS